MIIPPKYRLTKKIAGLLSRFEANNDVINSINVPLKIEDTFRRQSILGSSLFSARIEGNPLTISEVSSFRDLTSREQKKVEIANLVRATTEVLALFKKNRKITIKDILRLHKIAMRNILSDAFAGSFRTGHEGIFDQSGGLIYHAPPPNQVKDLIAGVLTYANGKRENLVPIRAVLSHLTFEKIHPFLDGSGRVGRLVQLAVLSASSYAMKGLTVVEEEIDKNRPLYYRALENSTGSDATEFVELMLEFLVTSSEKAKQKIITSRKFGEEDLLPPRRREILEIIKDHKIVSLDSLHRRFLNVDPRVLRYDLKCLMDEGFVGKIGKTRGALYTTKL